MRILARLLVLIAIALPARAQIAIKITPEPLALSGVAARDMGRWMIEACNDGPEIQSVSRERLSIAAGSKVRMIDDATAASILATETDKTFATRAVKALGVAGQFAALGMALVRNTSWAAGLGIGSAVLPTAVNAAKGYVPATPLP